MNWYIRFSEAVKKYSVTRQTLYNWVHDDKVDMQKKWRASYLKESDLKKCADTKIGEQPFLIDDEVEKEEKWQETIKEETVFLVKQKDERIDALTETIFSLQKSYNEETTQLKVWLRTWKMATFFLLALLFVSIVWYILFTNS